MAISYGHATHVGLKREHNEDTYGVAPELGIWLVADGMGGHEHGEVASATARDTVISQVRLGASLDSAIKAADEEIIGLSSSRGESLPMGTTIVVAQVQGPNYSLAWVGDSRIYLYDGVKLRQLSVDHSYVQHLINQGAITIDQARNHPHRNVVTQALGVTEPDALTVPTLQGRLQPGHRLLLCSDGLTEEVSDQMIDEIMARDDLHVQECVDQLVLAALDNGGSDNITVLLLQHDS